jgi:hypothetical protein
MSNGLLRGWFCLSIAFATFAGVSLWAYQQTNAPVTVGGESQVGKAQKTTFHAKPAEPKHSPPQPIVPEVAAPAQVEAPLPFPDRPRFFPKGGKGFGRQMARVNLSDRLGLRLTKPSEDTILQLGIAETDGLIVEDVYAGSLAESVGIKIGDLLLSFDGQNVPSDVDQFHFQLENLKTNEAIDTVLLRDGNTATLKGLILPEAAPRFFPQRRPFGN